MDMTRHLPTSKRAAVSTIEGCDVESQLVERAKDLEEDALASLYAIYYPRIFI